MRGFGALCCHGVSLDIRNSIRICDANCTPHVTGPATQELQAPSTTKDFRNYKCFYGVLVPEFFSATLNDSNFFPPSFNSACQPGTSIDVWELALHGSPHRGVGSSWHPKPLLCPFTGPAVGQESPPWVLQCTALLPHPRQKAVGF